MNTKTLKKKYRIALVDDHPVVLKGLADLLSETEDLQVCGKAEDVEEALQLVAASEPDLVIVDLILKGILGIELIKELRQKYPPLRILVFSVKREACFAERVFKAGADGYVVKEDAPFEILRAAHTLLKGGVYVSKKIREEMVFEPGVPLGQGGRTLIQKLSDRELQVFKLLGQGSNPRQIADQVGAGVKTVETYCLRIRKKLHLQTGYDLLRLAIQQHPEIWD